MNKEKMMSCLILAAFCCILGSPCAAGWEVNAWFTPESQSICPCDDDGGNPFTPGYNQTCDDPSGPVSVDEHGGPYLVSSSETERTYGYKVTVTISGESRYNSAQATLTLDENLCSVSCQDGVCNVSGSEGLGLKCINGRLYLGKSAHGAHAGYLWIDADEPSLLLATPAAMSLITTAKDVEQVTDNVNTGVLRQVMAPECLADIVVVNDFKYTVNFYHPADVEDRLDTNEYYVVKSGRDPFVAYTFENPAASTNDIDTLRITKVLAGDTVIAEYVWTETNGERQWTLSAGNGLRYETMSASTNGAERVVTRMVMDGSQNLVSKVRTTYHTYDWGEATVEKVVDPDGVALTTTKSYYTDETETGKYSQVASVVNPDGSWARFDYDKQGRNTAVVSSWKDAAITDPADSVRATYYEYTAVDVNDEPSRFRAFAPRTTTEKALGTVVGRSYNVYYLNLADERVEIEEKCADPGSAYGDSSNLRTIRIYNAEDELNPGSERIKSITHPDGRKDTYTYEYGAYATNANPALCSFTPGEGDDILTTLTHGTTDSPDGVAYKTTKETTIENYLGRTLMQETYAYDGSGYNRIAWTVQTLDDLGRPTMSCKSDGSEIESTWACCGKEWEKNANGIEYYYTYDALKRITEKLKKGVSAGEYPAQADLYTDYTYDAASRLLSQTVIAGGLSQVSSNTYDLAGRQTKSVNSAGLVTETEYADGGLTTTTTLPGGYTRITERYKDGQTKSVTGTAGIPQYYEYGVNEDGTKWTKAYTAAADSPVWVKTTTDLLGKTAKIEKPGYSTTEVTENFYNNKGQLCSSVFICGSISETTLYSYDSLGNQIQSGLDINANGELDLASLDRITETDTSYLSDASDWYKQTVSKIYATDNSANTTTNSITRQRLTGLGGATGNGLLTTDQVSIDSLGNQTVSTTVLDREGKKVTQTVNVPDSTIDQQSVTLNGLLVSANTRSSLLATLYSYDALGRRVGVTDARLGNTVTHYDSHGWIDYVEDAAGNRTTYTYDSAIGRRLSITSQLTPTTSVTTYFAYTAHGLPEKTWGSAAYPVRYEYDSYNRQTKQHTYRAGSGWDQSTWPASPGDSDETTWTYHEASGLPTSKTDDAGKSVSYTYTDDGNLATRTWARQDGTNDLVTTYSYDSDTGDMTGADYSDSTPDVIFTFDRLGRQKTAASSVSAHTFAYSGLLLDTETIVGDGITNVIDRLYDSLGRSTGFALGDDYSVAYSYDSYGRFSSLSNSVPLCLCASYTYLANSDLISGLTVAGVGDPSLSSTRSYEDHRNLLTQVKNEVDSETVSQYDYINDNGARRTSVKHSGTAFLDPAFNKYGYNNRSEVTSANRYWGTDIGDTSDPVSGQEFGYTYDQIGNRAFTMRDNRQATYTANNLNQYAERSVPNVADIIGSAEAEATVTVNNAPVTRHIEYFHKALEVDNDDDPIYQEVSVVGVRKNAGTDGKDVVAAETGNIFVPQNPEQFTYDDDGNMLSNGRWVYTWDCENRLVQAETSTNLPASVPVVLCQFSYDYQGRRVSKKVYSYQSEIWNLQSEMRFAYDGWNLVSEVCAATGTGTITDYYVWGLDLSGSLQGAGGIGGLLARYRSEQRYYDEKGMLIICHRPPGNPDNKKTIRINESAWPSHQAHGDTLGACDGSSVSNSAFLYTFDGNGNVSELLTRGNEQLTTSAHYEYSPFGETIVITGSEAQDNVFRFSTKYTDDETGDLYYGYRYYSPSLGRWLSRDPIGEKESLLSDPIKQTDDFALQVKDLYNRFDLDRLSPEYRQYLSEFLKEQSHFSDPIHTGVAKNNEILNLYGFVKNSPNNLIDSFGLACGPGQSGDKWVPDKIWGVFDFGSSCQQHDDCYAKCNGPSKASCDFDFWKNSLKSCGNYLNNFTACVSAANLYAGAVAAFGGPSFKDARKCCK